jgi:FKBP-type peptidyl-prolyl cis-trans isomerase FklB
MLLRRAAIVSAAFIATAAFAQNPQGGNAQQGGAAAQQSRPAAAPTATDKNKLSYAIGYELGSDFREKSADIDVNTVIRAIQDAAAGRDPTVSEADMRANLMAFQNKVREEAIGRMRELAAENKTKSDRFMAENRSKTGIQTLPNGIQYRVIESGNGRNPTANSEVSIHYRGSIASSGLEFDSSFARGQPVTFKVNEVLRGWQEVLPRMKVGDHWQVFLPPEMAYGERGQPPIGPNEALSFDIKLIEVK